MNRDGARDGRNDNRREEEDALAAVAAGLGLVAVAGAVAGGIYWLTSGNKPEQAPQQAVRNSPPKARAICAGASPPAGAGPSTGARAFSALAEGLFAILNTKDSDSDSDDSNNKLREEASYRRGSPPPNPVVSNINALLSDIYVRYVQLTQSDFELHYRVFDKVFHDLHKMMKEVDPYYRKYSSTVQFAGSHYDNLRIVKPDEFDMDIIIDLPLNLNAHPTSPAESDIFIEPKAAGFVQLRMGTQFQKLPMRDGNDWQTNKAAYEWMDNSKYLLRSKFLDWFKSVVTRALNKFGVNNLFDTVYFVDGVPYVIKKSESGPAITLIIENSSRGFKMDVDLVPALKFPESRWPIGPSYRPIPADCERGYWMVVGKPIKNGIPHDGTRSWRIALHNQERDLMHDSGNLKQAVRLIKKLRDSLRMDKIASYYIKTIFFWEIVNKNNTDFWHRSSPATLFKLMVGRLHAALVNKKIPYFWNKSNNLIAHVDDRVLDIYAAKLVPLIEVLNNPQEYKEVAKYLLTGEEYRDYVRFL